jgi:Glycosyl transferase family 2
VAHTRSLPSAVAIPVKDEEAHIGACLAALVAQSQPIDHIVLLLNNCTDRSAQIVRRMRRGAANIHVVERTLPPAEAHAGAARRIAIELAVAHLGGLGAILTTDADGRVPKDWAARNLAWLAEGYDAVCGMAAIDPVDEAAIPEHLVTDDLHETRYTELLDEIDTVLDPSPYDGWPRHTHRSGASIAVTAAALHAVGGVPHVAMGEDRALIEALERRDARIRHDPAIRVVVSGRTIGRAEGGMASTIARRIVAQDHWADDRLEPPASAIGRSRLRAAARKLWAEGVRPDRAAYLAAELALRRYEVEDALQNHCFGAAWSMLEAKSVILKRYPVAMAALPAAIREAEAMLALLRRDADEWPGPAPVPTVEPSAA